MKLPKTIGLTGLAGSGKSYAAQWLAKQFEHAQVWSFAAQIKKLARSIGWNGEKDAKGRRLLQDLGSAGREYHRDTWIWSMPVDRPIIIDDCRYINEAAAIRGVGGVIVRVIRPGLTPMQHSSETEQEHIIADWTLTNDEHFERELGEFLVMIR